MAQWKQLLPGLFAIPDTCNVYLVVGEKESIAIDFGSGKWLTEFKKRNLPPLKRVYLTHHHVDQCQGLVGQSGFKVFASADEESFLSPKGVRAFWKTRNSGPVPTSYSVLTKGISGIKYTLGGFTDHFWGTQRVRFISTPGHGPGAISIILDHAGKQVVFCGDAAHANATIREPYHLEWDHWTGSGIDAAIKGLTCLSDIGMDLLCPSHGPQIARQPRTMLKQLVRKLQAFSKAKGSTCPGEPDHYFEPTFTRCGARKLLEGLYQFGENGYLLLSETGRVLVIDPFTNDMEELSALLDELQVKPTDITATHYHSDHIDGAPGLKKKYKTKLWLHPRVAIPLANLREPDSPWRLKKTLVPDATLPRRGQWTWCEYTFDVAPAPGQTWWHCALMTTIAGKKVFFGGDSFQPNSRWNGTGGFCSFNGCRFTEGFSVSAQQILDWKPDLICTGHSTYTWFAASQYKKILRWSEQSEKAIAALCPSGNLEKDYYLHKAKG